jgi:hypothetical protein
MKEPGHKAGWILKADIQRRGLWYAPGAVAQIDPAVHAVHQDAKDLFRNDVDFVPEGLIWNDGSYLIANFDFDQKNPARDPYVIDYVDGKYVIVDEGEIVGDFQGFWEKPDFYNKIASNGSVRELDFRQECDIIKLHTIRYGKTKRIVGCYMEKKKTDI